jgi:calcineurin-like phosphoesterase family protein
MSVIVNPIVSVEPETDVWVITDTHFNENEIETYCVRPKGYGERIKKNWCNIVKPEDLVIHVGDVAIGGYDTVKGIMESLPGRKMLILGNHDKKSATWWTRNGFVFACEAMLFNDVWFTHHPARSLPYGAKINIHGHMHINRRAWGSLKPFNKLFCIEYGLGGNIASTYSPVKLQKFLGSKKITELGPEYNHPIPF